ncbi:hypothetical protein ACIO87_29775 [Streptomyces sp. NPDC087218]|uniref:hypothetical protein n=1 Tax=Streptomyces sp. NPDC087218 TaxID=3365769 RepID=UPI003808B36B
MEALRRISKESGRTFNMVMREALRRPADLDKPEASSAPRPVPATYLVAGTGLFEFVRLLPAVAILRVVAIRSHGLANLGLQNPF